jgi:hypothetical protein
MRDSDLWRFLTTKNWYKEDNCGTQVSLDHLRGIDCNPWPKEVTTTWSRHWPNYEIKSSCLLSIYFIAIIVFLSYHIHLYYCSYVWYTSQWSNQVKSSLLSFSTLKLVLIYSNSTIRPNLLFWVKFYRITYSSPSRCSQLCKFVSMDQEQNNEIWVLIEWLKKSGDQRWSLTLGISSDART